MSGSRRHLLAVVVALALVGGCTLFAPRPDPSRFFTLTPLPEPPAGAAVLAGRALGIGPIELPAYLDRPELVMRVGPNEVRSATSDYWAGSLTKQLETTLSQNLQALLGPASVETYPWYSRSRPGVIVEVDFLQFEPASDGQAHLRAGWRVKAGDPPTLVASSEANLARPTNPDAASAVAALSELLAQLSREIAAAVRGGR
jgi:uncharacterized protein